MKDKFNMFREALKKNNIGRRILDEAVTAGVSLLVGLIGGTALTWTQQGKELAEKTRNLEELEKKFKDLEDRTFNTERLLEQRVTLLTDELRLTDRYAMQLNTSLNDCRDKRREIEEKYNNSWCLFRKKPPQVEKQAAALVVEDLQNQHRFN